MSSFIHNIGYSSVALFLHLYTNYTKVFVKCCHSTLILRIPNISEEKQTD